MIHASCYGRLAKDPAQRTTGNGKPMTIATLAVDATPNNADTEETVWLSVLAFGRQAETLVKHAKGEMIAVTGRMTQSRWKDKATGEDRTGFSLMADSIVSSRTVRPGGGKRKQPSRQPAQPEFHDDPFPF